LKNCLSLNDSKNNGLITSLCPHQEILAFRKGLWTSVASRHHTPTKIFFGGDNDLMLFGTVAYVMKANGKQVEIDWAARAEFAFDEAGKNPKMKYYQVYLVSF
jgi:hypothetical protein